MEVFAIQAFHGVYKRRINLAGAVQSNTNTQVVYLHFQIGLGVNKNQRKNEQWGRRNGV
jgi:hypothetical protein